MLRCETPSISSFPCHCDNAANTLVATIQLSDLTLLFGNPVMYRNHSQTLADVP